MYERKAQSNDALSTIGRLQVQCLEDSQRWFGDMQAAHSLPHHALAMAGEVGEFCNIVKKIDRGSLNIADASVRLQLQLELTDVFVYLLNIAGLIGVDLEKSYLYVRSENDKRFVEERKKREAARG